MYRVGKRRYHSLLGVVQMTFVPTKPTFILVWDLNIFRVFILGNLIYLYSKKKYEKIDNYIVQQKKT